MLASTEELQKSLEIKINFCFVFFSQLLLFRDTVNFHLIYPREFPANMSSVGSFAYLPCKDITRRLMTFKSAMQTDYKLINAIEYPHNLMRNVARQGALTEFVLSIDLGILPSANIRRNFVKFAAKNGLFSSNQTATSNVLQKAKKSVYVLPIYELRSDVEPFKDKASLMTAVENKNARALMQETCWFCQKPTDYGKVRKTALEIRLVFFTFVTFGLF